MITFCITFLFFGASDSLKIWIPNTDINNSLNWDKMDTPKECDFIRFTAEIEIATFWNINNLIVSGLSLPKSGDIIFSHNIRIQFRNREHCPHARELKYIRRQVKGWLDPNNWKSDSEFNWLPHSERVPCAGESVFFPSQKTFAVQLPSILVPIGDITFDGEVFQGNAWSDLLKTELGFQLFKGPDDVRSAPWRNDIGCFNKKKCMCGRSSYTIRDGRYKETNLQIFQEAVCLYAMPKCQPPGCYSPVIPEGHCCGICGAVIKIKDNTKDGLNVSDIKEKVEEELQAYDTERNLKSYVGRTKDENIQIVVVADNSDDTIKSHTLANIIKRKLMDQKFQVKLSRVSGLRFYNYLFNNVSGVFFGTLIAVISLFVSIYYIYVVLPRSKFRSSIAGNPFMFARFENSATEENLEIGVEPVVQQELPQSFDNPMYSRKIDKEENQPSSVDPVQLKSNTSLALETTSTKEYTNPVYSELEKTSDLNEYLENLQSDQEELNERSWDLQKSHVL